jgi:hypothetical protein
MAKQASAMDVSLLNVIQNCPFADVRNAMSGSSMRVCPVPGS